MSDAPLRGTRDPIGRLFSADPLFFGGIVCFSRAHAPSVLRVQVVCQSSCCAFCAQSSMMCFMARDLETARDAGLISTYSADEAVGIAVNNLMFQRRVTRKQLGDALGVTGSNAGRKLRGEIGWSLNDLYVTSELLQIELRDILPQRVAQDDAGYLPVVAAAGTRSAAARGFAAAAAPSCPQRGSNPRPMD